VNNYYYRIKIKQTFEFQPLIFLEFVG